MPYFSLPNNHFNQFREMDQRSADYIINDPTTNRTHNYFLKKTLQFLLPISLISFLLSYFSALLFHPLHLYSSTIPFLNQALDRKCMFLICNGILAFLANNLMLNTSALDHGGSDTSFDVEEAGLIFRGNDHTQLDAAVQEGGVPPSMAEEIGREEWEEEEEDDDEEEVENSASVMMEELNEMRVSTEDLNKKFDEFIRRMKEEIRIEARQQCLIVV